MDLLEEVIAYKLKLKLKPSFWMGTTLMHLYCLLLIKDSAFLFMGRWFPFHVSFKNNQKYEMDGRNIWNTIYFILLTYEDLSYHIPHHISPVIAVSKIYFLLHKTAVFKTIKANTAEKKFPHGSVCHML